MSVTSKAPNAEKGARYLGELDQALCNGNWAEVQELARKTDKHAPDRKVFTLTARTEAQIASASQRPTTATSTRTSATQGFSELVPKLQEAVAAENKYVEDSYAAQVCMAEIHLLKGDSESALKALPQGGMQSKTGRHAVALGWLEVCDVKATFIRVASLESIGKNEEARQTYLAIVQRAPGSRTRELRRWTERVLARACTSIANLPGQSTLGTPSHSLRCFLAWSEFWQRAPTQNTGSMASSSQFDIPRRQVWKAFYALVSRILQDGLMYNPDPSSISDLLMEPSDILVEHKFIAAKQRQRTGLRRVEAAYESLLLDETQFPKAGQTNLEVEEWVFQVVENWKIFCGPEWTDPELGEGGKQSASRGVLDILYRAATKTFHSTAILRQLFTVHAALGEFDLAMHAFDSYVEIVSKGRARAEKTGESAIAFDNDDTAVLTAAEAMRILCRYGDREQAKKAVEIGKIIRKWVGQEGPSLDDEKPSEEEELDDIQSNGEGNDQGQRGRAAKRRLQPKALAGAYRAIGISQAHWARMTYDTDTRPALRAEALTNLRTAQTCDQDSIETAYALALLLAESRDVTTATQIIKRAIASSTPTDDDEDDESNDYARGRQLIPLWHLLAQCLTAKDDYEQGIKMCELAFEQFGGSDVLFGENYGRTSSDSEKQNPRSERGLVDQMESFEKEGILQIKMSQLAFVELIEGPEAAVDMSHELLGLYARLYGNPERPQTVSKPPPSAAANTPSKLGGTIRSIAGSIRPKSTKHNWDKDSMRLSSASLATERKPNAGPGVSNDQEVGVPISITVTNEDGVSTEKSKHHHMQLPFAHHGVEGDGKKHGNLKSARSSENIRKSTIPEFQSSPLARQPAIAENDEHAPAAAESPVSQSGVEQSVDAATTPGPLLKKVEYNVPLDASPPQPGQNNQPPCQDTRLPAPHPSTNLIPDARAPTTQDRQQKISLLVKAWLFTAGLYLRAGHLDDASAAVTEASKLTKSFEAEVGAEDSTARRFFERRWGGGKSIDELWADVWSAKAYLASARDLPFEAISHYEQALSHFPDHPEGIICLSNLLMDIYEEKIPAEEPRPLLQSQAPASSSLLNMPIPPAPRPNLPSKTASIANESKASNKASSHQDRTPAELNRLASRDRAYMLLSNLTRLGSGWDNSEAWYTLARAHELSKQVGKAKQALWWVVELEENRPMRPWTEVAAGGFTL